MPNAWYSNLSKTVMKIWNAINYWSCFKRLVTTVLVHRQPLGHRMFFQKHLLGHTGLQVWDTKKGSSKVSVGKPKPALEVIGVLIPEHGVLFLSEHCVAPATLSHLWQPHIIYLFGQESQARSFWEKILYPQKLWGVNYKNSVTTVQWSDLALMIISPGPAQCEPA